MTYEPDGYGKWGNRQSPLETGTNNPVLKDADPSVFFLLELTSAVITHHAGNRWTEATSQVGLASLPPVASQVGGVDPFLYLTQLQLKFPLLGIYRTSTINTELTIATEVEEGQIDILYILPPLDFRQAMALSPFLNLFAGAVKHELLQKRSLYAMHGIQDIEISKTDFGTMPEKEGGKLNFPFFLATIKVKEVMKPSTGSGLTFPLETAATVINVVSDDSERPLIETEVDFTE